MTDTEGCHDYKVVKQDLASGKREDFYVPEHGQSVYEVDIFKNFMLLYLKNVSKSIVKIIDLKTKSTTELNFGLEVCTILPGANEGYDINEVVLFVNTPFQYNVAYRYNFLTKILTKIQEPKLTGEKFDESQYKAHIV